MSDRSAMNKQEVNYQFLLQLPLVKDLLKENKSLKKKVRKMEKLFIRHQLSLLEEDSSNEPIFIKEEPAGFNKKKENIVYEIIEDDAVVEVEVASDAVEEEEVEVVSEAVDEIEEEVEVVEEEEEAADAVEEVEEADDAVEEVEVAADAVEEVEVADDDVEEEEEEEADDAVEEVEEEEAADAVEEAADAVEEEEGEVYEVELNGKTYYVTNEIDSIIYDLDENGDISVEVGVYKKGKPVFNKK